MSSIAIITARGGSKRIPKKNIKEFCGKPIIAYSIEAAIQSGIFDEVMVSTDSEEIADIAKLYGASVPFMRSEENANDYSTTRDVLMEVLNEYAKRGKMYDDMTCIYPTAPFVNARKLEDAMELFKTFKSYMLIPVVQFSYPPQRGYIIKNEKLQFKWEKYRYTRSQDLEPFYHDAGQFYFYDIKEYLATDGEIKENIIPFILPESEVQDIDNEEDWKMAEMKYMIMKGNKKNEQRY